MKTYKKIISIFLVAMMLIIMLPGCGTKDKPSDKGNDVVDSKPDDKKDDQKPDDKKDDKPGIENFNETGYPIVNDKITLKMFARKFVSHGEWDDMNLWKEMEAKTNIHIDWDLVSDENLTERRNIVLASNDLPDAFYIAKFSATDIVNYSSQGLFIQVDDLIKQYAPNLNKILEENPDAKKGLEMPDGHIYSFPNVRDPDDSPSLRTGTKLWYNTEWMQSLGLSDPKTTDELYEMLKAFKEKDPAGGGKTIPLASQSIGGVVSLFKGMWGLGTRGSSHGNVDIDESTGELRFIPTDPKYKELLEFVHKLHKEGLLDPEVYSMNWSKHVAKGQDGLFGSLIGIGPILINQVGKFHPAEMMEGPHGDKLWNLVAPIMANVGPFVITNANKYPEATTRWMDYFYTEEGRVLFFMGKEGETYKVTPEGEYEFLENVTNNPDGLNLDQAVGQFTVQPGGGYPGLNGQKTFKGAEGRPEAIEGSKKLEPFFPKTVWSSNVYTVEESEIMSTVGNDITTYIDESMERFISGDLPFSEWDNYVKKFDQMRLDEYMKVYKAATDRLSN